MINKFDERQDFFYENGFYLTSKPYRLGNMLAHYEVYKKIVNIGGSVIELGVFKGGSLMQWATFRELLENERSRRIIGFDIFGPFPEAKAVKEDIEFIKKWNEETADFLSKDEIEESLKLKGFGNVELVKGNVCETLSDYLEKHPEMRISLLHIDTDVYEPCKVALETCWEKVVPGGIILLDDYMTVAGETLAVDEFFKDKPHKFYKFPFSHEKPCYIIKE